MDAIWRGRTEIRPPHLWGEVKIERGPPRTWQRGYRYSSKSSTTPSRNAAQPSSGSDATTTLFGDKQVQLNCLASDFSVAQGAMRTRFFVLDTDESVVSGIGQISLASERLNLEVQFQK